MIQYPTFMTSEQVLANVWQTFEICYMVSEEWDIQQAFTYYFLDHSTSS